MKIKITDTAQDATLFAAELFREQVMAKPNSKIGLATGRTMDAFYYHLSNLQKEHAIDYAKLKTFLLDEYLDLPPNCEFSYVNYIQKRFIESLHLAENQLLSPDASFEDFDQAANDYERKIQAESGIDLQMLGIGRNGHIGLNEPGSSFTSRTRVVALSYSTIMANKTLFSDGIEIPKRALTMGIGTILEAKKIIMLATGESKADIVKKIIESDVDTEIPATGIKNHPDALFILDKYAAKFI
jgi:glucosamine-6-phosphate deaminase